MIDVRVFQNVVDNLKDEGNYRVFNDIVRERGKFPRATWYSRYSPKTIINCVLMTILVWAKISMS